MKRGKPLARKSRLQADPAKTREWQDRSRKSLTSKAPMPLTPPTRPSPGLKRAPTSRSTVGRRKKPSDGPWRAEVIAKRGYHCRRCGKARGLQADHIMSRSQTGASVVENGMMLCGEPCHRLVTENKILYEYDWLDEDQVAWLADIGYVAWDDAGLPYGRGHRNFAPRRGVTMKGGTT